MRKRKEEIPIDMSTMSEQQINQHYKSLYIRFEARKMTECNVSNDRVVDELIKLIKL